MKKYTLMWQCENEDVIHMKFFSDEGKRNILSGEILWENYRPKVLWSKTGTWSMQKGYVEDSVNMYPRR